jgi:hypothetical protein
MKSSLIALLILVCATSCNIADREGPLNKRTDEKIRKKVILIGEDYIKGQVRDPEKILTPQGIILIGDNFQKYAIVPENIFLGLINNDSKVDAVLTLERFQGQFQVPSEQLFIINQGGKLILNKAIEFDMRVLQIKDGIITARVPSHDRSSPLFSCEECQDTINYRFNNGELRKIE